MSRIIATFNPAASNSGQFPITLAGYVGSLLITNDSMITIQVSWGGSEGNQNTRICQASSVTRVDILDASTVMYWMQYLIFSNSAAAPASLVIVEGFDPNELPYLRDQTYPFALPRLTNVGNTVPVSGGGGSGGVTYYNVVTAYGADPTGAVDATAAINAAIATAAAATPSGGVVFFPNGTYKLSASLVITGDSIELLGSGWGTVLKPVAGALFDVISTPIPASVGLNGYVRNFAQVNNLMIDCSNMTGTTAGQGNAIHFYGARYCRIDNVYVLSCKNWCILLDGDNTGPGNNFGYSNIVSRCEFDVSNAGLYCTNCEEIVIENTQFKWAGTACAASQPAFSPQDTNALHLRLGSGYCAVHSNVFGNGGTYTTEAIRDSNIGPTRIIGNRFDQVRQQTIAMNGGNCIFSMNQIGSPCSATPGNGIQIGSNTNSIIGNIFDSTAGPITYLWAIAEAGGPFFANTIIGNFLITGASGVILTNVGSAHVLWGNYGYKEEFKNDDAIAVAANYTIADQYNVIYLKPSGTFTLTLPTARPGSFLYIKDVFGTLATHHVTVAPVGGATIDGAASLVMTTNFQHILLNSDGTNWYIIA